MVKQAETGPESIFIISGAAAAWFAGANQTDRAVTEQRISRHQRMWRKARACVCGRLCVWRAVPGQELTSADGAVSHVARLAGTQVSSDGVGADGVLITQILAAGALVVLWEGDGERNSSVRIAACSLCERWRGRWENARFFFSRKICGNSTDERTVNKLAGREYEVTAERFSCQQPPL